MKILTWITTRSFVYYFAAAIILIGLGDKKQANLMRMDYIKEDSEYPVLFVKGKAPFNKRKFRRAIEYYKKLAIFSPHFGRTYGMTGFCHYYLGEYPQAIDQYAKALAQSPQYFWFYYNLGIIYYQSGEYPSAIQQFKKVLPANLDNLDQFIPYVEQKTWDAQDHKRFYDRSVLLLGKVYHDSNKFLIMSYYRLEDYDHMLEAAMQAITRGLAQGDAFFYYYAGIASYQKKHFNDAISFFTKSIAIEPAHADAHHYLGLTLTELGRRKQAEFMFFEEAVLRKGPEKPFEINENFIPDLVFHPLTYVAPLGLEKYLHLAE